MNFKNKKIIQPISTDISPAEVHVPEVTLANQIPTPLGAPQTQNAQTPTPYSEYKQAKAAAPPELPTITWLPKDKQWTQSILFRTLTPAAAALVITGLLYILAANSSSELSPAATAMLCASLTILLVIFSIYTWALERVFLKANEKAWKAWLPIYNLATLYKISGYNPHWAWLELIPEPYEVAEMLDSPGSRLLGPLKIVLVPLYIISVIAFVIKIVIKIRAFTELARRFGKPALFGLLILGGPGVLTLGFGKSLYSKNPEIDHAKLFRPEHEPTIYQLLWRALLLFALIPLVYIVTAGLSASLLGISGFIAMLFFYPVIIVLSAILIPAFIIHYVLKSTIEGYGQKFIIINTSAIANYCFMFIVAYGALIYAIFMQTSTSIIGQIGAVVSPQSVLLGALPTVIVLAAFPFITTCYFFVAYALEQNLRTKTISRILSLGIFIVPVAASAALLIIHSKYGL